MGKGTLYLVPTGLGSDDVGVWLPPRSCEVVSKLQRFIAENPKTARAFLKSAGYPGALRALRIDTLDEHTPPSAVVELLSGLKQGEDCGLVSEAGCPAVADPGALLVRAAHAAGIRVVPLIGPSAVLLALMASGLNGQRFTFCGYLPVDRTARAKALQALEAASECDDATQIFIEAPYRNDVLLTAVLETCRKDTLLCVATDLTLASEEIRTSTVSDWQAARPALNRRPTVFLLYREIAAGQKR